jgi:hypothetical protein
MLKIFYFKLNNSFREKSNCNWIRDFNLFSADYSNAFNTHLVKSALLMPRGKSAVDAEEKKSGAGGGSWRL